MTTHEQTARNAEIVQRRLAGEATGALAMEYQVTATRIAQLVRRHREKAGEISAKPRAKGKTPETAIRPRLRKVELGLWECAGDGVARRGETPEEAYGRWVVVAISQLSCPLDKQPQRAVSAPEQPYTGPVTVLPGTKVAPRALTLPPAMRFAMERAGQTQVRLRTLGGA
ncbi:hypothetical protein B9P52_04600 [Achromobacter denitrificans]|uniref:hypothetical protein n=1 Tax=Achromobacter denitrificans TaxID=32002 RepID=UPI000B4C5D1E|nr:hypothetical protein [Achromobacter denitrificans]ASC63615.1 hypothetical protein B9P52_04600 [Achromobacter denitrificans]